LRGVNYFCRAADLIVDALGALEQWVEHGTKPAHVIASYSTSGVVDRTRPLCPYPQVATHKGSGSIDEATNFVANSWEQVSNYPPSNVSPLHRLRCAGCAREDHAAGGCCGID